MAEVPTVKIATNQTEQGYFIINESDYDPAIHKLYEEKGAKKAAAKAEPDAAE